MLGVQIPPALLLKEMFMWWKKFVEYLREVKIEVKKVVMPDKKSLWGSTFVVIVVSLVLGLAVGLFDLLISKGISLFTR
ncbi:TPA: preprotein translocase subunit SecE [candidate division WOR-3 bacterium]|uniref:Protein translocase subunit SecE n=1 Tax=candidate division WOR-3 bacterium TaxID=2052148 RepID=A0A350HCC3_UNCW3|nr:preprotein translocase subunit SecE [candidate division WOR-3 bacterium]